jgi:hypothetical protein
MNIDIVNKQVSKKLGLKEKDVTLVNYFFWNKIYEHLYMYNPNPVNIKNVCVLYPDKYLLKHETLKIIKSLRFLKKRKIESLLLKNGFIETKKKLLRHALSIRKANKYTN